MISTWLAGLLVTAAVLLAPGGAGKVGQSPEQSSEASGEPGSGHRPGWPGDDGSHDSRQPSQESVSRALVLLALAYRSGLPTSQVLLAVADVATDPLVERDLRQVAVALRWGASEAEAWGSVGSVWSGAGRAVAIAHQAGIAPGPLMLSAADELWRSSLERLELAAARVGVRLVAPLGLVLLPAFCLTTVVPLVAALGRELIVG